MATLLSSLVPNTNISYYTVPIAWLLSMTPHFYAIIRHESLTSSASSTSSTSHKDKDKPTFNKTSPRTFQSTISQNPYLTTTQKDEVLRAEGASLNGFENLGWYAAAVVAANTAGVHGWWCNALGLLYLANRAVYNVFYIMGMPGPVRGIAYYGGIAATISLYVMAGNAARRMEL